MPSDNHQQPHPEPTARNSRVILLRLVLPLIVVICGVAVAAWLLESGPKAKPRPKMRNAVIVDVRPVEFGQHATTISVMGAATPMREVVLKPQVNGAIISISDRLVPGGRFKQGDPLMNIDPRDYLLAVQQLSSEVARVEADRQIELGQQRVAQKEYELLGESVSAEEKALMLREPQLENVRAILDGTRARLEQAKLDLERTVIKAPFNAVVISREVNLGTSVTQGTPLATLVDSDAFWVEAPIPASQLNWIDIGREKGGNGSQARIFDTASWGATRSRVGQVIGMTANVEEQGRMARLLVEVADPLGLQSRAKELPILLLGSYVRVEIAGQILPHAAFIERDLIRDGDRVWIMDDQDKLDIRPAEIAFRGQEFVLVTGGISQGERLVVSNLPSPVQGMNLRLRDSGSGPSAGTGQTKP